MKTERAGLTKGGGLWLPVCAACSSVQYPIREVCVNCLADKLERRNVESLGKVLATTVQHYTLEENFKSQLPLCVASVKLGSGPVMIVFADPGLQAGQMVSVISRSTEEGKVTLFAVADDSGR